MWRSAIHWKRFLENFLRIPLEHDALARPQRRVSIIAWKRPGIPACNSGVKLGPEVDVALRALSAAKYFRTSSASGCR